MSSKRKCQAYGGPANCTNPRCPEKLSGIASFFAIPDKKPVASEIPQPQREKPVVGSKHVHHVNAESYEVSVPISSTLKEVEQAKFELLTYANAIGYPNAVITSRRDGNQLVLSFDGLYSSTGTDYNTQVYPNITWVEDLMQDRKTEV